MFELVSIRNREITQHLEVFTTLDSRCSGPTEPKGWDGNDYDAVCQYHTSDITLRQVVLPDPGSYQFTRYKRIFGETPGGTYFFQNVGGVLGYDQRYTSGYIPRGFVGWHLDSYVDAWCLMFVYNAVGNGWFKYHDPTTDRIVTIHDQPGWTVKAEKLDRQDVWHCARADSERYFLALMYQDQDHWRRAIDTLQSP
jgi:hypothetical protein